MEEFLWGEVSPSLRPPRPSACGVLRYPLPGAPQVEAVAEPDSCVGAPKESSCTVLSLLCILLTSCWITLRLLSLLQKKPRLLLHKRFLGAPATEVSFSQINFIGGYPRGGGALQWMGAVRIFQNFLRPSMQGQGDTSPTKKYVLI